MSIGRPSVRYPKLCALAALLLFFSLLGAACTSQQKYPAPTVAGSSVVIDVSALQPEIPRFFTYQYDGRNINFFVLRMDNGVQSYFDACASCYPHKLGYKCESGSVVCGNCGQRFPIHKLEKGLGGCYPIKLEGRLENNKYLIPRASLEAEAGKF